MAVWVGGVLRCCELPLGKEALVISAEVTKLKVARLVSKVLW